MKSYNQRAIYNMAKAIESWKKQLQSTQDEIRREEIQSHITWLENEIQQAKDTDV